MTISKDFDVSGLRAVVKGLDAESAMALKEAVRRREWARLPLNLIAVGWDFPEEPPESVEYVEGVPLRVTSNRVPVPSPHLLRDYLAIVEKRDRALEQELPGAAVAARRIVAEEAEAVVREHGAAMLCGEHGLPPGHGPGCDLIAEEDRVSHLVRLAEWCRAAKRAAEALREGRSIQSRDMASLRLPEAQPPQLPVGLIHPEDLALLHERLRDPVVDQWRRLEAWIEQMRRWSRDSLGILPALFHQLEAECARDGPRRVCRNPECQEIFKPITGQQYYCGALACKRARARQRHRKMERCLNCGRPVARGIAVCKRCDERLGSEPGTS